MADETKKTKQTLGKPKKPMIWEKIRVSSSSWGGGLAWPGQAMPGRARPGPAGSTQYRYRIVFLNSNKIQKQPYTTRKFKHLWDFSIKSNFLYKMVVFLINKEKDIGQRAGFTPIHPTLPVGPFSWCRARTKRVRVMMGFFNKKTVTKPTLYVLKIQTPLKFFKKIKLFI